MILKSEVYDFVFETIPYKNGIDAIIKYGSHKYIAKQDIPSSREDLYIEEWENYVREAKTNGVFEVLKKYFRQFTFPIKTNISKTKEYKDAIFKGKEIVSEMSLELKRPNDLFLEIYENDFIGKVPVLVVSDHYDFERIVSAFCYKNEPKILPHSMGAIFINGLNNWNRIKQIKKNWLNRSDNKNWSEEFKKNILPKKYLYQDKLIVLSRKEYSNVRYDSIQLPRDQWLSISLEIRKIHECVHLYTLQQYGMIANHVKDEIIADYIAILCTKGFFNKKWFLLFMGLEKYPIYRKGGRLENYLENHSFEFLHNLLSIIMRIIDNIAVFEENIGKVKSSKELHARIKMLSENDLLSIAFPNNLQELMKKYKYYML